MDSYPEVVNAYPHMEENSEEIEKACYEGMELCSDASDLLLSCCGSFAYWDVPAEAGGGKRPEQLAVAIADLLAVQDKVQEALAKAREAWRLLQEKTGENDED